MGSWLSSKTNQPKQNPTLTNQKTLISHTPFWILEFNDILMESFQQMKETVLLLSDTVQGRSKISKERLISPRKWSWFRCWDSSLIWWKLMLSALSHRMGITGSSKPRLLLNFVSLLTGICDANYSCGQAKTVQMLPGWVWSPSWTLVLQHNSVLQAFKLSFFILEGLVEESFLVSWQGSSQVETLINLSYWTLSF